ncbi:amidase [Pseudocnuella soli]|uniref:amidase n=1 Tax=Pseudocnuella soli TaxID=2502779 RepID=UPI001049E2BB|nr:amidase [Pseudocnuella soli]
MRKIWSAVLLTAATGASAQSRTDTIKWIQETSSYYDLQYTAAEADSAVESMREFYDAYRNLHGRLAVNALPYPFAFKPAPVGFKMPQPAVKKANPLPQNVSLPQNREDLAFYPVGQLASLIKNKKITSVALTEFFLQRLKKWDDSLQCVISYTEELAMQQARKADAELAKGIYRGPLHGIPYGLKDLFAVKGTRTTWGSTPYREQVIEEDAFVYTQLQKAGAVLCAKLSLGALAFNDLWFGGQTKNPWNLRQGSSGSSAGSAAATAAGLLPFAIGTETWGSIVSPSTRCGTTGLRPTFGAVSRSGAMVLSWSLDKIGPICRSAADCALVFAAIKGTDGLDPSAVAYPFNYPAAKPVRSLRIAYAANYFDKLPRESAEWQALEVFKKLNPNIRATTFPDTAYFPADIMNMVISAEGAAAFDELTRTNRDSLIERQDKGFWPNIFRASRLIPAAEYINANRFRAALIRQMHDFMQQWDVVIVPTFSGNQSAITNLTGHPALVFPIGFSNRGNPLSITLLGNLYDEASILQAGSAFQDATDFNKKHPPLFVGK